MRFAPVDRPARRRRLGAATVEMAAVAPVLVMLILGSIEFGRAMMVSNLLTTAAREGARVGAMPNKNNTDITNTVSDRLNSSSIPYAKSTVTVKVNDDSTKNASTANSGDKVTVHISVKFGDVSWLPSPWFLSKTSPMNGQAVMRRE